MRLYKSKMANRLVLAKLIGFIIGLLGFICVPYFFGEVDSNLRWGIFLWYTTLGGVIGIMGIMDRHPVFTKWKFPFWFRGIFFGAWFNFLLSLFIYNDLVHIMSGTKFEGFSPFWLVLEGAIIGLIIDFFATRFGGEGKELCK